MLSSCQTTQNIVILCVSACVCARFSSFGAAHSKGVESTSSSDSESSSRSESDSEGTAEEQPQHPVGNSVQSEVRLLHVNVYALNYFRFLPL